LKLEALGQSNIEAGLKAFSDHYEINLVDQPMPH
jgi:hypothetical protein